MPKVSPLQSNFNAGEFSPLIQGRVDADRYKQGLAVCENYIPTIQGALTRRPGTYYVSQVKDSTKNTRLIPFEFSTTQAYMLEFGHQYIRFYKNNGPVLEAGVSISGITNANPAVVTAVGHGYSLGDRLVISGVEGMSQVNNQEFEIGSIPTANTFELSQNGVTVDSSAFDTYVSGGTAAKVYEIGALYDEAHVFDIKYTQSADVLYIVHPLYAPRKITRTGPTTWTNTAIDFLDGPYLPSNKTTTTITPSSASLGASTLTASAATFSAFDVGRQVRLKHSSTWGWAIITGFTSSTVVDVTVKSALGGTGATADWRLGMWSTTTGNPSCVIFHEDRLAFAGSTSNPQRVDLSNSGDYENFAPSGTDGTIVNSNALSFSLNSNDVSVIRWLSSDEKGMPIGTVGSPWIVRPASTNEALSPTNITAKRCGSSGSANVQAIQVGKASLFVQTSGRKIMEMAYFYDVDGFRASDLTQLSEHITQGGLVQIAHMKEPQSIVMANRADGTLVGMTYERESDSLKAGWHRHPIGGIGDAAGNPAKVKSVAVIPSQDGSRSELWMIVERYIGGAVHRYVEYMTKFFESEDDQEDAFFGDCGLTYDVPATITGITQANPAVVTAASHGYSNGDTVRLSEVAGMTEVNERVYKIANKTANTFELTTFAGTNINSTAFTPYVSGGEVRKRISSLGGLMHLNGETVSVLADGAETPDQVVTNGKITLATPASIVQVGYANRARGQMLRLEAGAADGTALGKKRRTHTTGFLVHRTLGLKVGMNFDELYELPFRTTSNALDAMTPLYSGIIDTNLDCDYDFENQICWQQDGMLPGTILAVMPKMVTQDRG